MAKRMTLSIAIVDPDIAGAKSLEELSKLLAATKRVSKRREESNFVVYRPDGAL
jgi:hypothetical protein